MPDLQPYIISITIVIGFAANMYMSWKTGSNKAQLEATSTWKSVADGYEGRLKQVENDAINNKEMFQEEIVILKAENKELLGKYNQLIGENKILKEVVVNPSPLFEKTVTSILSEIKTMNEKALKHREKDDKRFADLGELSQENNSILKKIVTEQFETSSLKE